MSFLNPPKGWGGKKENKVKAAAKAKSKELYKQAVMSSIDRDNEKRNAKLIAKGKNPYKKWW